MKHSPFKNLTNRRDLLQRETASDWIRSQVIRPMNYWAQKIACTGLLLQLGLAAIAIAVFTLPDLTWAKSVHGIAFRSELKYKAGFSHFDWANPRAPKGGTIRFGARSPFDTLNPFTLKGNSAPGLGLIFESLTMSSWDEAFAKYGTVASGMELAKDGLSVTFQLHKTAKFSDGKPLTAQDVVFSFKVIMSDDAPPFYRSYYGDIKKAVAVSRHQVKFIFKQVNPELHLIIGQLSILPKHIYSKGKFATDFSKRAVGSGPYIVESFDLGKFIRFKRNPNFWGKNLNVYKGQFNFDKIHYKVFRDESIWLEGLKAGEFDFARIASSKLWAVDVKGDKWNKNYIIKSLLPNNSTQGMQCYIMNLRKPIFKSRKLRHAIALAFDFDWSNKTLFYDQYKQMGSYWNNSELGAKGLPSKEELVLLEPLKGQIPAEVFLEVPKPIGQGLKIRERLRMAHKLLAEDGWKLNKSTKVLEKNGQPLEFEIALRDALFERVTEPFANNLARIGIKAKFRVYDRSQFGIKVKGHQFDMTVISFGQSESPGNEQVDFWHSSKADVEGSRNHLGLKNKAIDTLVDVVVRAKTRKELVTATRALDRVLWFNYYVVPHWYLNGSRVTYWNKFNLPRTMPRYYGAETYFRNYGWYDEAKARRLEVAVEAKRGLR